MYIYYGLLLGYHFSHIVDRISVGFEPCHVFIKMKAIIIVQIWFSPLWLFSSTAQCFNSQLYRVSEGCGPVWHLPESRMETRRLHDCCGSKYTTMVFLSLLFLQRAPQRPASIFLHFYSGIVGHQVVQEFPQLNVTIVPSFFFFSLLLYNYIFGRCSVGTSTLPSALLHL